MARRMSGDGLVTVSDLKSIVEVGICSSGRAYQRLGNLRQV
jgi:hypothetical protein